MLWFEYNERGCNHSLFAIPKLYLNLGLKFLFVRSYQRTAPRNEHVSESVVCSLNISFSIPVFPCRWNVLLIADADASRPFFAAVEMQAGHTFSSWLTEISWSREWLRNFLVKYTQLNNCNLSLGASTVRPSRIFLGWYTVRSYGR